MKLLLRYFIFKFLLLPSTFEQTCGKGKGTTWNDIHVALPKQHPLTSDTFANYPAFLKNLPDAFSNIRGTTIADIIQNTAVGSELPYDDSSFFSAYPCEDGFELKGYGDDFVLCSRMSTVVENHFEYGDKKCVRNYCDLKALNEIDQPGEGSVDEDVVNNNVRGSEADPETLCPANYTAPFDCYNDKIICSATICTKHGIHGFGENGYACATSSEDNILQCLDCLPEKSCQSYQYACGVLRITMPGGGDETQGLICCSNTVLDVVLVPVTDPTHRKPTYGAEQINDAIAKFFEDSGRDAFTGTVFDDTGDGFVYSVCPPDYFVQGFNGETLFCTKEALKINASYHIGNGKQCLQQLCFPEVPETECVNSTSNSPKYFVCSNGYVTKKVDQQSETVCQGRGIPNEERSLSNQGLSCDPDKACPGKSKPCGVIQYETPDAQVPGLVCCNAAPVAADLYAYINDHKQEFLYYHTRMAMERKTLTVENETNEVSMLFNEKIQEDMHPDEILQQYFEPLYQKKMWLFQNYSDGYYPETLIMCPNNTYVRGVQTNPAAGDAYQIVCSELAPYMEKYEQKMLNTDYICPKLVVNPKQHIGICGANTIQLGYEYCTDGHYFALTYGLQGERCHENPCGENSAVCGITNHKYSHVVVIICCEPHVPEPIKLPDALDEEGNLDHEAIKFVLNRFAREFQRENCGRRGTVEEVISYHREKDNLPRTLFAATMDDYRSAPVNEAMASGSTIPDALRAASGQNGYEYWLIDENYDMYYNRQEALRTVLCPTNMFVRGHAPPNTILCSEEVPIFGKQYTTILGLESTCTSKTYGGLEDKFSCVLGQDEWSTYGVVFCTRGFYGRNSPSYDTHPECNDGFQCSNKVNGSKVCGMLVGEPHITPFFLKIICCNEIVPTLVSIPSEDT